jgi:ribonuclease HII
MAWIIGIDEAGYGPNLGPLVMSAVAYRVPHESAAADLWEVLAQASCREAGDDDRIWINDSKILYSTSKGIADLERNVLAVFAGDRLHQPLSLFEWLEELAPTADGDDGRLPWYGADRTLPVAISLEDLHEPAARFRAVCETNGIGLAAVHACVIEPASFNRAVDHWGSKGGALAEAIQALISAMLPCLEVDEPVYFLVDKHGGRNTYAALLQHCFPDGLVFVRRESMASSQYDIQGYAGPISLRFQPRADGEHFCVALASMLSKYLREMLMGEFNRFWLERLPGLEPTAGYPMDAMRFYDAIRPMVEQLGIAHEVVWRKR